MSTITNSGRTPGRSPFDAIMKMEENSDGTTFEYWSAREAMQHLGYLHWQGMENIIRKARAACRNSGHDPGDHFRDTPKMVPIGSNANRAVTDVQMTRFGMYLLAMNGDPDKAEIAAAQRYFAVQTYRAEQFLPPPSPPTPPPAPAAVPAPQPRPWAERFRRTFMPHVRDLYQKHAGCFSVVSAVVSEILFIEDELVRHLMTTRGFDRPDISIGVRYARFRRDDLLLPETIRSACLFLPEQGIDVEVRVYEGTEWPTFQTWFRGCYLPEHLPAYFHNKPELKPYPAVSRDSAAEHASVSLGGHPAVLTARRRAALVAAGGFAPAPRPLPPGRPGSPPALPPG